jgi:hypothetical protein
MAEIAPEDGMHVHDSEYGDPVGLYLKDTNFGGS